MKKAIQQAIERAREGKNQEAYELIEQELRLSPGNGLAWTIRAQLATDEADRLESLEQALELAPSDLARAWLRREIERAEAAPADAARQPSPHALDIALLEDDTDHSMKTQAMPVPEKKPRWRGCLILSIAAVVLIIVVLVASVFLVPTLRQLIPSLNLPFGIGPAAVAEEPTATELPTETAEPTATKEPTQTPRPPTPTTPPPSATPSPTVEPTPTPVGVLPLAGPKPTLTELLLTEDNGLNTRFGWSVAVNSNQIVVVGAPHAEVEPDDDTITRRGAAYIYQFDPTDGQWVEQEVLSPPVEVEEAYFGTLVAIDDQNTIAVGWDTGAVSIYQPDEASPGDWVHQQTIDDVPFGAGGEKWVAIDGDLLAVGSPGYREEDGEILTGAVYVYQQMINDTWEQQAILTLEEPDEYDQFGTSVAVDANTIVVGMIGRNDSDDGWGGVYIYQLEGSEWVEKASFSQPEDETFSIFGLSVDIDGSVIAAGTYCAPLETGKPVQPGAAFIFEDVSDQGDWSDVVETRLDNPDPAPEAFFGVNVAIDGRAVAVSEMTLMPTEFGYARGLAYRFTQGADRSWSLANTLEVSGLEERYMFGVSIDIFEDMVVVGAPRVSGSPEDSPPDRVFLFEIPAPSETAPTASLDLIPVTESWVLTSPVDERNDGFGTALAITGQTIIAGQPISRPRGDAHIYTLTDQDWKWEATISPEDAERFGGEVAADGDTIIVGDRSAGDTRVFIRDGESWQEQGQLLSPEAIPPEYFTLAVAISGDTAAIGVPLLLPADDSENTDDVGTVYIFTREGDSWSQQATISPPEGTQSRAWFGLQLALDQDTLVVAATDFDDPAVAYVYQRSGSSWEYRTALEAGAYPRDKFNVSLDISGNRIVLGIDTMSDEDLSPVIVYEDVSQAGDWSKVEQTGVPRPVDTLYTPADSDDSVDVWTTAAIDGDQIAFAGIKFTDDIFSAKREPGTAYLSTFVDGQWTLTHQLQVSGITPHYIGWTIDFDDGLLAIGGKDPEQIGQILIYDLTD